MKPIVDALTALFPEGLRVEDYERAVMLVALALRPRPDAPVPDPSSDVGRSSENRWISTSEAAAMLGMTSGGVLNAARTGHIAYHQTTDAPRSPYRVLKADVARYRRKRKGRGGRS